jgi:hypothetical protein
LGAAACKQRTGSDIASVNTFAAGRGEGLEYIVFSWNPETRTEQLKTFLQDFGLPELAPKGPLPGDYVYRVPCGRFTDAPANEAVLNGTENPSPTSVVPEAVFKDWARRTNDNGITSAVDEVSKKCKPFYQLFLAVKAGKVPQDVITAVQHSKYVWQIPSPGPDGLKMVDVNVSPVRWVNAFAAYYGRGLPIGEFSDRVLSFAGDTPFGDKTVRLKDLRTDKDVLRALAARSTQLKGQLAVIAKKMQDYQSELVRRQLEPLKANVQDQAQKAEQSFLERRAVTDYLMTVNAALGVLIEHLPLGRTYPNQVTPTQGVFDQDMREFLAASGQSRPFDPQGQGKALPGGEGQQDQGQIQVPDASGQTLPNNVIYEAFNHPFDVLIRSVVTDYELYRLMQFHAIKERLTYLQAMTRCEQEGSLLVGPNEMRYFQSFRPVQIDVNSIGSDTNQFLSPAEWDQMQTNVQLVEEAKRQQTTSGLFWVATYFEDYPTLPAPAANPLDRRNLYRFSLAPSVGDLNQGDPNAVAAAMVANAGASPSWAPMVDMDQNVLYYGDILRGIQFDPLFGVLTPGAQAVQQQLSGRRLELANEYKNHAYALCYRPITVGDTPQQTCPTNQGGQQESQQTQRVVTCQTARELKIIPPKGPVKFGKTYLYKKVFGVLGDATVRPDLDADVVDKERITVCPYATSFGVFNWIAEGENAKMVHDRGFSYVNGQVGGNTAINAKIVSAPFNCMNFMSASRAR